MVLLTLPDLTLRRARVVRVVVGQVVDHEDKPVVGSTVSQAGDGPKGTFVKTNAEGRFRLRGVHGGKALVYAEAAGFRFGGIIVGPGADPVVIRLTQTGEPPNAILKTLASPLSRQEERALARELLEPLLPLAQSGTLSQAGASVIPALARVNPTRVLDMIENRAVDQPSLAFIQVVLGQFEDDPDLALATIQDDLDPAMRAASLLALADFRPAPNRELRETLLERALVATRQTKIAGVKIRLLGQLADRWLELGSLERARPILLEGQAITAAWPKDKWLKEAEEFAEVLAVIDLPAALAIFERQGRTNVSPIDPASLNRYKGYAAIRLASIDPAQAESLIAPSSVNFHERPEIVLRVVRKMAIADLARARRLLETLDNKVGSRQTPSPGYVPFGLGMIAGEFYETNPILARELLDEAFAALRKIAVDGWRGSGPESVANLMAELLPVVERLDPERLAERIWMVAACRPPSVQEPNVRDLEGMFALTMLVARYDRAIADVIVGAGLERLADLIGDSVGSFVNVPLSVCKTLTVHDPRAIVPLLQTLPDASRQPPTLPNTLTTASIESQIRLAAAQILGFSKEARPREAGRIGNRTLAYREVD